jgi:hypothetical protein
MRLAATVALAALAGSSSMAGAQLSNCDFASNGPTTSETINGVSVLSGTGGIKIICKGRNLTLTADSGHMVENQRADLFGHVHYDEPTKINLTSDFLTYFQTEERVLVTGHVIATLPTGSTLTGPEVTYLRPIPGSRPLEDITAVRSPTVTLVQSGDTAKPVTVNAVLIHMHGDSLVEASRKVVITRSDLIAHADSAFLDGRADHESMRLMFTPVVEGTTGRKFKLEGKLIDAFSRSRKLERVIARGEGHATSQDLEITSDTIDLRMKDDFLDHAIAWSHVGQAHALSPGQSMVADSIDVTMPKQKVQVVRAFRRAFAQADADSVRFRTPEKDWLRGDTITAWFDTTATKDTSSTPPIKQIVAYQKADSAQAYYHLAPSDTGLRVPAITYVRGRQIQLDFDTRKVAKVFVQDSVAGLYLEPKRDTTTAKGTGKGAATKKKPPATPAATKKPPTTAKPPAATKPRTDTLPTTGHQRGLASEHPAPCFLPCPVPIPSARSS